MSRASAARKRGETILALSASGLNNTQIAKQLSISTKTVQRHLEHVKPALKTVNDLQQRASSYIEKVFPIEKRIDNLVALSKKANNEAVRQGSTMTVNDWDGFVPAKARQQEQTIQPQALFMFPPGTRIDFSVSTTTSSKDAIHKDAEPNVIDVTPTDTHDA